MLIKPKARARDEPFRDATSRFCALEMASSYDDFETALLNYYTFGTHVYCDEDEFNAAKVILNQGRITTRTRIEATDGMKANKKTCNLLHNRRKSLSKTF